MQTRALAIMCPVDDVDRHREALRVIKLYTGERYDQIIGRLLSVEIDKINKSRSKYNDNDEL